MSAERFISARLHFKGKVAVCAIAISFLVIIVSLAISEGFRKEIRSALSQAHGDISVSSPFVPPGIDSINGITGVTPAIYVQGIVKSGLHVKGVCFKGTERNDSIPLLADIPAGFAREMRLGPGDKMPAYFVGEKVQARNFIIGSVYDDPFNSGNSIIIRTSARDLQRLSGMQADEFTEIELSLDGTYRDRQALRMKAGEIAFATGFATASLPDRFPQIFDWLDLIDVNVTAILVLMILVAGFNMISGLLIFLFRNTSTIGTLKSLGMTDRKIAGVFLLTSSRAVLKGMLIGNAAALLFCLVQDRTHILKLNPDNYFLSFVPASVNLPSIIVTDLIAFAAIMLMITVSTLFISKVDPAKTVRSL